MVEGGEEGSAGGSESDGVIFFRVELRNRILKALWCGSVGVWWRDRSGVGPAGTSPVKLYFRVGDLQIWSMVRGLWWGRM